MKDVGARIRSFRKKTGWTQAQLAHQAGVSRETVTRIERGRAPDFYTLERVSMALGVTRNTLYPDGASDSLDELAALVQREGFVSLTVLSKLADLADHAPHSEVRGEARVGLFVAALTGGDCARIRSVVSENQRHRYDFGPHSQNVVNVQRQIFRFLRGNYQLSEVAKALRERTGSLNLNRFTHDLLALKGGFLSWAELLHGNVRGAEHALEALEATASSQLDLSHWSDLYVFSFIEREQWSEAEALARLALTTAAGPMYPLMLRANLGDAVAHLGILEGNLAKVREGLKFRTDAFVFLMNYQVGVAFPKALVDLANVGSLVAARFSTTDPLPELDFCLHNLAAPWGDSALKPSLHTQVDNLLRIAERWMVSSQQLGSLPDLYRVRGQQAQLAGRKDEAEACFLRAHREAKLVGNIILERRASRCLREMRRLPVSFSFPSLTWRS